MMNEWVEYFASNRAWSYSNTLAMERGKQPIVLGFVSSLGKTILFQVICQLLWRFRLFVNTFQFSG